MKDTDHLILENLYNRILCENESEDVKYIINHNGKEILVEWEGFKRPSGLQMIRIYDTVEEYDTVDDNKQIGAVNFRKGISSHLNGVELGTVIVVQNYRRKGYSRLLIQFVLDFAKKQNLKYIYSNFVTPIMLESFKKMFPDIKFKKDRQKKGHFKDVIIKL
jgi:GNAT superfamily N-acetyltransferase